MGYCMMEDGIYLARAALHMWEEPCISGESGSGAVFFSGCNLRCVYCQNHEIAGGRKGRQVSVERLSQIFLELQDKGAANINLVTPDHFIIKIAEAVLLAKEKGIDPAVLIEGDEFIVKLGFFFPISLRKHTVDLPRDRRRVEEFQNADALMAFLDVVAVHVLIDLDRVTDPFLQMRSAETAPLFRKFGILGQDRHKIWRKGIRSCAGFRSDNELRRDLHRSQRERRRGVLRQNKVIQNREAGRPALGRVTALLLLP